MIQINQIKLNVNHSKDDLDKAISKALHIHSIPEYSIVKKSIDARDKQALKYIYSVRLNIKNEESIVSKSHNNNIMLTSNDTYNYNPKKSSDLTAPIVIVGAGPAGLYCAYMLSVNGYKPIVIERGKDVESREKDIENYWSGKALNIDSNVQFGEGGAGTFSDGKLNTMIKDKYGRIPKVLEIFVEHGAPKEILYDNKPHIGTDNLKKVIKNIREDIINHGGQFLFETKLTNILISNNKISSIEVSNKGEVRNISCSSLVLAIGHSARDTFHMLNSINIDMEQKAFAIGLRIEHPKTMIDISQYGDSQDAKLLGAAPYKLTHKASNGRSVYSFCMCPGGYVVDASSVNNMIAVNGMSNYKRDAINSNSAIVVNVVPDDFEGTSPLDGIYFQEKWERQAYEAGNGKVPIQTFGDFVNNVTTKELGNVSICNKGQVSFANLNDCLPPYVISAIIDGVLAFDKKIKGFARKDSILCGVETRTSSPVRINRDDNLVSNIEGIYPCGEGAGYAGGIVSAAVDGIKVFEAITRI